MLVGSRLDPPIYLDYNATTPVDPAVFEAMRPYLQVIPQSSGIGQYGNPSSAHDFGHVARDAVELARGQVAALLGAGADEIVFTGGGSEANNHALKGVVFARFRGLFGRWAKDAHVVTTAVEHPAV